MKRIFIFLMILIPAAGLFSLPMMIGMEGDLGTGSTAMSSSNTVTGSVTSSTYNEMSTAEYNFNLFFDASYFRIDVGYQTLILPIDSLTISNNVRLNSSGVVAQGFNYTYFTIGAMAKLPIEISKKADLWFGLGVEYVINLSYDMNMDGTNDNIYGAARTKNRGDMNDLFGVFAMGFTYDVNETLAIVPSVKFKYDFTPFPYTDAYITDPEGANVPSNLVQAYKDNNKYTILSYEIGIGIALRL